MDRRRTWYQRLSFFLCLAAVYGAIFAFLCRTPFYDVTGAHNDRLFSADDVYCATEFYSADMDDSARIIKHPLFIVYGSLFTRAEEAVFGTISGKSHYQVIVASQMVLSLLSTFYLERILRKQYGPCCCAGCTPWPSPPSFIPLWRRPTFSPPCCSS